MLSEGFLLLSFLRLSFFSPFLCSFPYDLNYFETWSCVSRVRKVGGKPSEAKKKVEQKDEECKVNGIMAFLLPPRMSQADAKTLSSDEETMSLGGWGGAEMLPEPNPPPYRS